MCFSTKCVFDVDSSEEVKKKTLQQCLNNEGRRKEEEGERQKHMKKKRSSLSCQRKNPHTHFSIRIKVYSPKCILVRF